MPRKPLESLGSVVRTRRGQRKLREAAREIGIGTATLMRVEGGRIPDVETFGKICRWLQIDPGRFLGFEPKPDASPGSTSAVPGVLSISAHLRADQTPKADTVHALAQMLLLAAQKQQHSPDVPSNDDA
jgi:transcriptional regulator with XRE-family HTH domain